MTTCASPGLGTPALLAAAGRVVGGSIARGPRPLDRTGALLVAAGGAGSSS